MVVWIVTDVREDRADFVGVGNSRLCGLKIADNILLDGLGPEVVSKHRIQMKDDVIVAEEVWYVDRTGLGTEFLAFMVTREEVVIDAEKAKNRFKA